MRIVELERTVSLQGLHTVKTRELFVLLVYSRMLGQDYGPWMSVVAMVALLKENRDIWHDEGRGGRITSALTPVDVYMHSHFWHVHRVTPYATRRDKDIVKASGNQTSGLTLKPQPQVFSSNRQRDIGHSLQRRSGPHIKEVFIYRTQEVLSLVARSEIESIEISIPNRARLPAVTHSKIGVYNTSPFFLKLLTTC